MLEDVEEGGIDVYAVHLGKVLEDSFRGSVKLACHDDNGVIAVQSFRQLASECFIESDVERSTELLGLYFVNLLQNSYSRIAGLGNSWWRKGVVFRRMLDNYC